MKHRYILGLSVVLGFSFVAGCGGPEDNDWLLVDGGDAGSGGAAGRGGHGGVDGTAATGGRLGTGGGVNACKGFESYCLKGEVATCVEESGKPKIHTKACEDLTMCREGQCVPYTQKQANALDELDRLTAYIRDNTGFGGQVPYDSLLRTARQSYLEVEDPTDTTLFTSAWGIFRGVHQGHQALLFNGCGKTIPYYSETRYGVCVLRGDDGLVVTMARDDNSLGLEVGDRIIEEDGMDVEHIVAAAQLRPVCTPGVPNADARAEWGIRDYMGTLPPGAQLRVVRKNGATETVKVPKKTMTSEYCSSPFTPTEKFDAQARVLEDGTAVIVLPGFISSVEEFPSDSNKLWGYLQRFEDRIYAEFEKVKDAPRLIWDIRDNGGGLVLIGVNILNGFSGARSDVFIKCEQRVAGTNPPMFSPFIKTMDRLTPGGRFSYSGKVAVLVNDSSYSAADYFAYFAKYATDALVVGTTTSGAYGSSGDRKKLGVLTYIPDSFRCMDERGKEMEGRGVEPHVVVRYQAQDLAVGRDTVLEAAVKELNK